MSRKIGLCCYKTLRDVSLGILPIILGLLVSATFFTLTFFIESEIFGVLGIISIFIIPYILYRFIPIFSIENNYTVKILFGAIIITGFLIGAGYFLFGVFKVTKQAPAIYEDWQSLESIEHLGQLRDCQRDPSCVLTSQELAELKEAEK